MDNETQDKKIDIDDKKRGRKVFSTSETVLLVIVSLLVGLSIGFLVNSKSVISIKNNSYDKYLNEFIKNYEYILNNYYQDVDKESLINSAISGMMESLDDPYSVYIDEEQSDNFSITLNGSYQGIGVQIAKEDDTGYMLITAVFKNSPAEEAGLLPGDLVISIDDKPSIDMSANEFSSMIKNGSKDTYELKILRNDEEININLKKNTVTLSSVASDIYEVGNKKVGYIYIGIFANNTYSQFKENLRDIESKNIDYLIIDVRSNTGGHLTAVDSILDLFLNKNQIMYQFEQSGSKTAVYGTGDENKNYSIVLLGDEVSASASEVLIAGLKENLGSKLIGKKTYGKGTVQELVTLSNGTQYKITVKKWLTPKGKWINETEGIVPDIEVDLDPNYYETGEDTQLNEALNYIESQI